MASVNKVTLLGNLGKDPEVKSFQNGGRVCNFSIATSETWKDKATGQKKERTEWTNVAIFSDGLVGVAEKYLRKGSKVYLEGKLQTRKWQDQNGNDRYSTEVVLQGYDAKLVLLDSRGSGGGQGGGQSGGGQQSGGGSWNQGSGGTTQGGGSGNWQSEDDLDDDIPFDRAA